MYKSSLIITCYLLLFRKWYSKTCFDLVDVLNMFVHEMYHICFLKIILSQKSPMALEKIKLIYDWDLQIRLAQNNSCSGAWNCLLYHVPVGNCYSDGFSIFAKANGKYKPC